jgi:hypothetical protein
VKARTLPAQPIAATTPPFSPSGFFVLSTPLLPFDAFLALAEGLESAAAMDPTALPQAALADRAKIRARLAAIVQRPEVLEALFIASPSLWESAGVWLAEPESERGQKAEPVLLRYVARMAGRPTPFGLFAGCSVGRVGEATRLAMEGQDHYRRNSRLDMDYVAALSEALAGSEEVLAGEAHAPNESL